MPEPLPAPPALETLRADAAFLRHYLENYVVHVPVKDAHDKVVNGFAAVQIPDWAVKQRLDDIDAAIVRAAAWPELLETLRDCKPFIYADSATHPGARTVLERLNAALANAEGEEPTHAS